MKVAAVLLAALLAAACGHVAAGPGGPAQGTLQGAVLSWPCAPIERVGSPCAGRPFADVTITFAPGPGGAAATATTDGTGRYSIRLAPGTYTVSIPGIARLIQGSRSVVVTAGRTTEADFVFDSGIR